MLARPFMKSSRLEGGASFLAAVSPCPSTLSSTFCGLISACMSPWLCNKSRALTSWNATCRSTHVGSPPDGLKLLPSSLRSVFPTLLTPHTDARGRRCFIDAEWAPFASRPEHGKPRSSSFFPSSRIGSALSSRRSAAACSV